MTLVLPTLALMLASVLTGRLWGRWPKARRGLSWLWLIGMVGAGHGLAIEEDPITRMVVLCCLLLSAMKGMVYAEWAGKGKRLPLIPYLAFSFLWFGMDPEAFRRRRACEWKSHLKVGLCCMVAGTMGALLVRGMDWRHLLLLFVPLSVGFHFGALRVLTAGWRSVGIPVRTLFRNPLISTGLADFWGRRWNLGYSQMMARVVQRPAEHWLGARGAFLLVFLISGILHEVAITLPVKTGFGAPTVYFLIQAVGVELERSIAHPRLKQIWALFVVVAPVGLLFPPTFRDQVILPCLRILPDFI